MLAVPYVVKDVVVESTSWNSQPSLLPVNPTVRGLAQVEETCEVRKARSPSANKERMPAASS